MFKIDGGTAALLGLGFLALVACALMGCSSVGEVLPASQAYVEELHEVSMAHANEGDPLAQIGVGIGGVVLTIAGLLKAYRAGNTTVLAKQHKAGRAALEQLGEPSGTQVKS